MALAVKSPIEAFSFICFIAVGINFLITGLAVNFVQLVLWLLVRPLSVWLFHKINYYCTYLIWGQFVFLAEWWSSSTCLIYTDDETWKKMGKEHAIILLNHSYDVDWLFCWFVCEQATALGGCRALVKKTLKMTPILGWNALFSENAFLDRNWDTDKSTLESQIALWGDNPDPCWLHVFAEGTRYTPEKYAAAVEFARKSGLPTFKHLLVPRTKGFNLCLEKLRGKFPAVYCSTMVFDTKLGAAPVFKSLVLGRPIAAEVLIERVPLETIPEDLEGAGKWLHQNYLHKDQMIDEYKNNGKFPSSLPGRNFSGPIRCHYRPRRLWTLLAIALSSCVTLPPVFGAFYSLFCSGIVYSMIGVVLIGLVIFALLKMMELSSSKKAGSEYGQNPRPKST